MTILEYVAMCAVVGAPLRRPVEELKRAQEGRFEMEKLRASPSASAAVGAKLYV